MNNECAGDGEKLDQTGCKGHFNTACVQLELLETVWNSPQKAWKINKRRTCQVGVRHANDGAGNMLVWTMSLLAMVKSLTRQVVKFISYCMRAYGKG